MNLPHQEPILFAKKILLRQNDEASILCKFEQIPTLGMGIEAAAQSCGALADKKTDGFLAGVNSVEVLKVFDKKTLTAKIKKIYQIDNMELFSFELEDYLKGKLAIYAN